MGILSFFSAALKPVFSVIDKAITDKDLAQKLKADLQSAAMAGEMKQLEEAASVIRAEATGESFLQRNWRPIVMLSFTALIMARWLGLTVDVDAATEQALLEIVKVGLGGYVIGRSGEKMMREWRKSKEVGK